MKTPNTPTDSELAKQLANSILRDAFAAAAIAGIYAGCGPAMGELPNPLSAADAAFEQADKLLSFSHTPKIIEQIKNL